MDKATIYIWKKDHKERKAFQVKNARYIIDRELKAGDYIKIEELGLIKVAGTQVSLQMQGSAGKTTQELDIYSFAVDSYNREGKLISGKYSFS